MVLPTIVKPDTVVLLVVVPVSCASFAVAISSNSDASYERMVVVEEGVIAWTDRDHRYVDVPSCLLNGILFQGPYKEVPEGTVLSVRPNARARVFVVVERSCSGQLHETLPEAGWQQEEYAPRWHGMPTMTMFHHDCCAGAAVTLPATQGTTAVFSVVVVPVAGAIVSPVEVSCTSTRVAGDAVRSLSRLDPVPLTEGCLAWNDAGHRFVNVPGWMVGATLFRSPHRGPPAGSTFAVRPAASSVVYVIVEEELDGGPGRSGGLLPTVLVDNKWERRGEAPTWSLQSKLAVFARRVSAREALSTPEISDLGVDGAVVALVVKVDIEAFDASVQTSNGLEYGRLGMEETVCVWSDCANVYTWVPTQAKGGIHFSGPHNSTPHGTRLRVHATGAFRAYVIFEAAYRGGQARSGGFSESLPADGWKKEVGEPSWGNGKSDMKTFSKMAPEGEDLHLPPTVGQAVFSIAVVNIASDSDKLADELKRAFKAWDADGKGGIQRRDLHMLLSALCPGIDDNGKEALLDSMDKNKTGVVNYEEFADAVILSSSAA